MRILVRLTIAACLALPLNGCLLVQFGPDLLAWAGCPAKSVPSDAASQAKVGCRP